MIVCLRAAFGRAVSGLAIAGTECVRPGQETVPILIDAGGEFAAAYGARPGMVWLVRPDGHIGFTARKIAGALKGGGRGAKVVTLRGRQRGGS